VLGLLEVQTAFNVPVYMHAADRQLLSQAAQSAKYWLHRTVDPVPPATHFIKQGQILRIGNTDGFDLKVHHTPGHTPGSVTLTTENLAFVGDTIFAEGVGRTDFSYSDEKKLWESIEYLNKTLSPDAVMLSGHGEACLVKHAAALNSFA
jgi:glyoxylase-like metal-dependent hydrolase (beta-lactamase superfamily II)